MTSVPHHPWFSLHGIGLSIKIHCWIFCIQLHHQLPQKRVMHRKTKNKNTYKHSCFWPLKATVSFYSTVFGRGCANTESLNALWSFDSFHYDTSWWATGGSVLRISCCTTKCCLNTQKGTLNHGREHRIFQQRRRLVAYMTCICMYILSQNFSAGRRNMHSFLSTCLTFLQCSSLSSVRRLQMW